MTTTATIETTDPHVVEGLGRLLERGRAKVQILRKPSETPPGATQRERVLTALRQGRWLTDEQLADRTGDYVARVRRRELVAEGLVADTGAEAATRSGAKATVWTLTFDGRAEADAILEREGDE